MSIDQRQTVEASVKYQLEQYGKARGIKNVRSMLNSKVTQRNATRVAYWTEVLRNLEAAQ
jgi:hypothetical protein